MSDVLNPQSQFQPDNRTTEEKINDRAEAFNEILKVMEQVKSSEDRIKLLKALRNYIQSL